MDIDSENTARAETVPRHSETWWFPDGNIILQADDVLFRVHQGMLAYRSTIFRGMLSVADGSASETVEGCPLVRLSDTASELDHFFLALWDYPSYAENMKRDFQVFVDGLTLSTKYDVDSIRQAAIKELSIFYPSALPAWLRRYELSNIAQCDGRPFVVAKLIRDLSLPLALLPAALYDCCEASDTGGILDGGSMPSGRNYQLASADLRACLRGYERLAIAERTRIFGHLRVVPTCTSPEECLRVRFNRVVAYDSALIETQSLEVTPLQEPIGFVSECCQCEAQERSMWNLARENLWNDLPGFFDLPPWEELLST